MPKRISVGATELIVSSGTGAPDDWASSMKICCSMGVAALSAELHRPAETKPAVGTHLQECGARQRSGRFRATLGAQLGRDERGEVGAQLVAQRFVFGAQSDVHEPYLAPSAPSLSSRSGVTFPCSQDDEARGDVMARIEFSSAEDSPFHRIGERVTGEMAAKLSPGELDSDVRWHHPGDDDRLQLFEVRAPAGAAFNSHSHDEDEIILVVDGELHAGSHVVRPGGSMYVPGGTVYAFRAGPAGLRFYNFRPPP